MKTTANNSRYLKKSISFFVFWIVLIVAAISIHAVTPRWLLRQRQMDREQYG